MNIKNSCLILFLIASFFFICIFVKNEKKSIYLINEMQYREDLLFDLLIDNVSKSSNIVYDFENIKDSIFQKMSPPFLFYRYSENMCISCVNEDLSILQKEFDENKDYKVLILPDYTKSRENEIFLNNQLKDFQYMNIESSFFPMPHRINGEKMRYFAVVNSKKELQMIFFPHKGMTQLTNYYFSKIHY